MKINNFLQSLQEGALRHHRFFFFMIPLTFIVLALTGKPANFASSLMSMLNKNGGNYQSLVSFNQQFHIAPELFVNLQLDHSWKVKELCVLRRQLDKVREIDGVYDLQTAFELRQQKRIVKHGELDRVFFYKLIELNCHEDSENDQILKQFQQGRFKNLFTDESGKSFSFTLFSKLTPDEIGPEPYLKKIKTITKSLEQIGEDLGAKVQFFGNIPYQYSILEGINHNLRYNFLTIIILLVLFYLFFKSRMVSVIYFSTLVISSAFLMIMFSLTVSPIDVLNNSLFLFLALTTLSDFIFILLDSSGTFLESFKKLIFPCFLTSFTTMIGFFSLMSSGQEITTRFGLMTGLCALVEWAVLFFWGPCLIKFFNIQRPVKHTKALSKVESWLSYTPGKKFCYLFLSLFILFPFSLGKINFNEHPLDLFDDSFKFVQDLKQLKKDRGFMAMVSFITKEDGFTPEMKEQVAELPHIKMIEWADDIKSGLKGDLENHDFEHMLGNIQTENWYLRRFSNGLQHHRFFISQLDIDTINNLKLALNRICPDKQCYLAGETYAYGEFAHTVPRGFVNSSLLSIILVGVFVLLFTSVASGRFNGGYLFSAFFGVIALFVFLGLTRIEINFVTAGVVSILVGLTGDNALHFATNQIIENNSLEKSMNERGLASLISTLIMLCLCTVFFFFNFNPPKLFGIALIAGLSFNIWGDFWLLKGLSSTNDKKHQ